VTTFVIQPGALVAVPSLVMRGTVFAASAEAPNHWVIDMTDAIRRIFHTDALAPPESITTEAEREARRQEQIQRKIDLAADWTTDLHTRGFTSVEGRMVLRVRDEAGDFAGRLRPEAIIIAPTHEDGWRTFMQTLRAAL
jgi:hypothetical protein